MVIRTKAQSTGTAEAEFGQDVMRNSGKEKFSFDISFIIKLCTCVFYCNIYTHTRYIFIYIHVYIYTHLQISTITLISIEGYHSLIGCNCKFCVT
jgi:hypothetical protein